MENGSGSTAMISSKTGIEMETPNNILQFPFMFHIDERLQYFDIFRVIFNEF